MASQTGSKRQFKQRDNGKICIGLALGSGSARGWAHIGVIQALAEMGIQPDVVAGSSVGAFIGAAYASNQIDAMEKWACALGWKEIIKYIDLSVMGGGFIQGGKLRDMARSYIPVENIEELPRRFAAVATDLHTGREVWFQEGSLLDAVRASVALPGVFTPVRIEGRWLVDGGLCNPVPVSLCRALGADVVIAVNLNEDIVGKHLRNHDRPSATTAEEPGSDVAALWQRVSGSVTNSLINHKEILLSRLFGEDVDSPGLLDVLASSLNIMQDRITRSRMAGDPPDILLTPRLSQLGLMEFDQAQLAIEEGRASVRLMQIALEKLLEE
jgi:NTE family protein